MSTSTENLTEAVVRLFADRLNVEVPAHDTDLMDAGLLDSLMLVDLIVNIERDFGVSVSLDALDLDKFRTVNDIAAYVGDRREHNDAEAA